LPFLNQARLQSFTQYGRIAGLGLAGAALGFLLGLYLFQERAVTTSIPDVRGLEPDVATKQLERAGYAVEIAKEGRVGDVPVGMVALQNPNAGSVVRQGRRFN